MEYVTVPLEDLEPKDGVSVCAICNVPWPWEWEDHYYPCANYQYGWLYTVKVLPSQVREPNTKEEQ